MIHFDLAIDPVAKGRPRATRTGHMYTPEKTRRFERDLRALIQAAYHPRKPLTGPLVLVVTFSLKPPKKQVRKYPICKPDLDNFLKAFCDSANGVLWRDDAQLVGITAVKVYAQGEKTGHIGVSFGQHQG